MVVDSNFYRTVFSNFPEPLFILDENFCCVSYNVAFGRWLGFDLEDDANAETFWPNVKNLPPDASEITATFETEARGEENIGVIVTQLPDGKRLMQLLPESGMGGSRHFHAQRLRTLGMLAGGVAHDFNNILAGVLGHVSFLKTILPQNGTHTESLAAIEEGAKKASGITQQILKFSKMDTTEQQSEPINMVEMINKTWGLLRGAISPAYNLRYELPDTPIYVKASEARLAQVLVNLVINARDAMDKGEIVVKLKEAELSAGKMAIMTVVDNGKGIPPELLEKIFEPYFSTKKDKGTGLGLATVNSIVKSYGGMIKIKSEIGKGTSVAVCLPLCSDVKAKESNNEDTTVQKGKGHILVVDDEDAVRDVLAMSLQHLGYDVDTAASGDEAIKKVCNAEPQFDLVILDMLMPKMSGDETFFRISDIQPGIRVLAVSGYTSEESVQRILRNGGKGFLQKPFTIEELAKNVKAALE